MEITFKKYLETYCDLTLDSTESKRAFCKDHLKMTNNNYYGDPEDSNYSGIQKEEYAKAVDTPVQYITSKGLDKDFEWENFSFNFIILGQRLCGKILLAQREARADLLLNSIITLDEWENEEGETQKTLRLKCEAVMQASNIEF